MEILPIIVFRISGKYAHFRRPYTNVSSLSYPFPPRPTIIGLLGAILGIQKDKVAKIFNEKKLKIAVEIEKHIKTFTHVTNFRQAGIGNIDYSIIKPKKSWNPRKLKNTPAYNESTQIPMELLRNPSFLIHVSICDNNIYCELNNRLKSNRCVYTPCLGLSEFLANIEYINNYEVEKTEPGEYETKTIVPKDECKLLINKLDPDKHQIQELKVPHLEIESRKFSYRQYLVNMKPDTLPIKMKLNTYKMKNTILCFL
ncbi:MAG: hypothetical protein APR63_06500 [Desulfuromonas sp. SDB]|nr:MAG: hypothetical protein APR63_06500 [Desulfuromonas sp. SDB]